MPEVLTNFIERLWNSDPEQRPTITKVRTILESFLGHFTDEDKQMNIYKNIRKMMYSYLASH